MPRNDSRKSPPSREGIFISYARSDGKNFADDLRHRLIDEYHFQVWQDIVELEGGKDWWLQIEAAIKSVEFLVMVMTPGALASQTTRKEWRLARQEGVCVLPVMAEAIDFTTLPRWMRDTHFFDFKFPEQWERFIRTLQSHCQAPRVPFMVEDKPDDFVERPDEFNQLLALLLDPKREEPIAITAALRGAGGYGKTTLAKSLCHDEAIQNAFDDGILWVTLGETPGDLTGRVEDLIYTISGERPGFSSAQAAAARLAELLADRDILLVIDDVWNSAHLRPFLQGGSRCSRLITTRNSDTLPARAKGIDLDAMRPDEATRLLGFNLPECGSSGLQLLAQRLGEWPLLLKLVNATLRYRVHDLKQSFAAAIAYVNAALDECGLIAFDQDNPTERHQAVAKTLEVSLQMLDERDRQRYFELAVFPEDVNIPLATLEKLWSAAGYKPIHTEQLCEKLHKLSLLLHFDLSGRTIRLHDVMRQYLVQKIGADLPKLHARFLDAYRSSTSIQTWADLPAEEPYLWHHLAYHLLESGQTETLRHLLLDYNWLANKLAVCEVNALLEDYDSLLQDQELQLLQSALRLSTHVLARDCSQLQSQLLGRLLEQKLPNIRALLQQCKVHKKGLLLRPLQASLTIPGGPLLRTLAGHSDGVVSVAITPDGKLAVSASKDKTLKVWDLASGEELRTLEGHRDMVSCVAITPDGKLAVSASHDTTLKVWDLMSGQELRTLEGHYSFILEIAITFDGRLAVSASDDTTLKVWDLIMGKELRTLKGHSDTVGCVALKPDGKLVVSASAGDDTLKVWDLATGQELNTFEGYGNITSIAFTFDGKLAVLASYDNTLKVWNFASGEELYTLEGHDNVVTSVVIAPNGKMAISASWDNTLKVWDLTTGQELRTLKGHSKEITSVALTPNGKIAVSASLDNTLKVWDLVSDERLDTIKGHNDVVFCVAITSNGRLSVSASRDTTLKVWNLASGEELYTLEGHSDFVYSVAITPDDKLAVSASYDNTLKVWDLALGEELRTLEGHNDIVTGIALTPDGNLAVSASKDGTLKVWDVATGQELRTIKKHNSHISSFALMPDGKLVVSASAGDDTLKVWDLTSGEELHTLIGHSSNVTSVVLTPDSNQAVSASFDKTLKVWDLTSGQRLRTFKGHSDLVWSVALTPDGKLAVSVADDTTLRVWNLQFAEELAVFTGDGSMYAVSVAPDGRTIVAGDVTGRVHFLRLEGVSKGRRERSKKHSVKTNVRKTKGQK